MEAFNNSWEHDGEILCFDGLISDDETEKIPNKVFWALFLQHCE